MATVTTKSSSDSGRWIAGATTVVAAAVDLLYGTEASLIVPLVFGPFVASALASVRDTVVVAATATVLGVLLGWPDHTVGTSAHVVRVASVAVGGCLAVALAQRRTAREAKLRAVTRVAEVAQQAILHPLPPEIRGVALAARYCSASSEAQIGGDFYEALDTPWGLRLIVGDVRGKGLDAVHLASVFLGEFRSRAVSEPALGEVARLVDAAGGRHLGQAGEDFATAIFVQLDGELATIVRAGHPPPLVADQHDAHPISTTASLPLCLGTEGIAERARIPAGARVLFYSDGALEGRDADGTYFDLASSFRRHLLAPGLATVLEGVLDDLQRHCQHGISDDVVLVIAEQPCPVGASLNAPRDGGEEPRAEKPNGAST